MKNVNKIIEYGLYLLVFLLPWQTRWIIKAGELNSGYWEYGTISLYVTDILLLAVLGLFIVSSLKKQVESRKSKVESYWWIIAGLELTIFISIFFAADKFLAIYKYGIFLLGVGLFWLIVSASYNKTKLYLSLLAGIFIQACLGIWQFLTQSSFSSKWLGVAIHRAGELGTSVIEIIATDGVTERWLRAYGGLDHPNMLGGILAIGLLLFIYQSIKKSSQLSDQKSKIYKTILNYFLLIIFVSGLFFSFSRAAWLGFAAGLITIFILLLWRKDFKGQKKLLELVLIGGVLVFIIFSAYGDLAVTRFKAESRLEEKSYVERISSMKEAKEIIKDKWLFGAGIGNYTLEVHKREDMAKPSFYFQPAHNVFLLVWAEIGIFGMLFFVSLLYYACYSLIKNLRRDKNFNVYCICLLAAMIVMFLVDHWWWSLHFGVLFFWLIMGLMLKEKDV